MKMVEGVQLGLFESTEIEVPKDEGVEWSYSRRNTLERCLRRYYYEYYGASRRTAKAEPQKETLQFLKTLSNRHLRTGDILHLVIRTYLKKLQQGERWSPERLSNWAREIYRRDRDYSRTPAHERGPSQEKYPPQLLIEFHYRFAAAEELYFESEQRLLKALNNFLTGATFAFLRLNGTRPSARVEQTASLKTHHFTATGKVDLAFQKDGKIVVSDWKIGEPSGADESLQLLFYALWAVEEYQCLPEDVEVYRAYLADNEVSTFAVSERNLQRARARIVQDIEKMNILDEYGRNAIAKAFTPCGQPRICDLCPFQGVCSKE